MYNKTVLYYLVIKKWEQKYVQSRRFYSCKINLSMLSGEQTMYHYLFIDVYTAVYLW